MSVDNDFEPTPCLHSDSFTTTAEDHQAAHSAKSDLKTDTVSNARSPTNRTTALPGLMTGFYGSGLKRGRVSKKMGGLPASASAL